MATIKQRKTVTILLESKGKKSVGKAMKEAGYPEATAKNPQQLTRSKSWESLMDIYLPEEKLTKLHNQQLNATRTQFHNDKRYDLPDNDARLKALDFGYKLRGKYPKDKIEISFLTRYKDLTDDELREIAWS